MTSKPEVSWPDWSGETALIVGTGASVSGAPLYLAEGVFKCIVVKSAYELAPWADVLYGIDMGWWIARRGAPKFKGLKVTPSPRAAKVFNLRQVRLKTGARIIREPIGTLGCGLRDGGGHSGWQAINLAIQFGATRIVLVGFDMHDGHWKPNDPGVAKPDHMRTKRWRDEMDAAVDEFRGVEVINATPGSALKSYPFKPLMELAGFNALDQVQADQSGRDAVPVTQADGSGSVPDAGRVRKRKNKRSPQRKHEEVGPGAEQDGLR